MGCCGQHEHPDISEEMNTQIAAVVADYKHKAGSVITVLRKCQEIVGYLPIELINKISDGLGLPRSEVFGVASFYSLFLFEPKGRHKVKVCMGTACYVKGIAEIKNRVSDHFNVEEGANTEDMRFSLDSVRCVGACGLAPVVIVNEDTHGMVRSDKIVNILDQYK
jgi:NADH:ubiquinone oxidoreductase subunit E